MCFMIQIQEFFNHYKNQHAFLVLKGVTPTFSNLGILLKIDMKNCPLLGKLLSVWRTIQYCPNQPNLPRQLKPHIDISMFPILDTNLCIKVKLQSQDHYQYYWILFYAPWGLWCAWPNRCLNCKALYPKKNWIGFLTTLPTLCQDCNY